MARYRKAAAVALNSAILMSRRSRARPSGASAQRTSPRRPAGLRQGIAQGWTAVSGPCPTCLQGGQIGARVGELFRDKLESLGLKRDRLCFHSFRHTVAGRLEAAAVSQTDAARVLGHTIAGMSYGVYSSGPGLKRLAAVVEADRV